MDLMEDIGAFIAQLRKEQNMTQKELADKLGVTDKAVSKWERGKGIPDVDSIERLSNVLDVSVTELFNARKDEKPQDDKVVKSKHKILYWVMDIIYMIACCVLIILGCYMLLVHRIPWSFPMAGGMDGPTAVFVAVKPSMRLAGLLIALGIGLIGVKIFVYVKDRKI